MMKSNQNSAKNQVFLFFFSNNIHNFDKWHSYNFIGLYHFSDEYDHLNHTGATSTVKPQYHRMNGALNITKDEKEVKESNIGNNNLDTPGLSLMNSSKLSYSSEDSNS